MPPSAPDNPAASTPLAGQQLGDVFLATRTARRVVAASFAAVLVLVLALMLERANSLQVSDQAHVQVLAARQVADHILLLDEQLTLSANLAAASGQAQWVQRYEQLIPQMDAALARATAMAEPDVAARFNAETSAANDRLVVLERQAFERVARSDLAAAQALLAGAEYAQHKAVLAQGSDRFMQSLQDAAAQQAQHLRQRSWALVLGILALAALAFAALWQRLNQRLALAETEHRAAQAEVTQLALYDTLTGLANRRLLGVQLSEALALAQRESAEFALLMLDLDSFKPINDRYGHASGDRVLVEVAQRLRAHVRHDETVARLGGDEFVVLLRNPKEGDTALRAGQRLIDALSEPMNMPEGVMTVGASAGIALFPTDAADADTLLRRADVALYRAKAAGRGQCCFFQSSMDHDVHQRALLESELRTAITVGQIVPYFQPQMRLNTSVSEPAAITGFEVLARWLHPVRGVLAPADFIAMAEQTHLIDALTQALLRAALKQATLWPAHLSLSINIAPQQLKNTRLPEQLQALLQEAGIAPQRLEIEITESALVGDLDTARQVLLALRERGIRVALDDFGTGYSSLAYLAELPIDHIKIDRSFVRTMHQRPQQHPRSASVVNAVLALGRSLQIATTAEGLETQADVDSLVALGCVAGQGFFFAQPVPAEQVAQVLKRLGSAEPQLEPNASVAGPTGLPTPTSLAPQAHSAVDVN
jgi:diguanylate cyclase (GGDEF)-like protein